MIRTTTCAAISLLMCSSAFAADIYSGGGSYKDEGVYSPVTRWSGFILGAHIGGAWADTDWADIDLTGEPVSFDDSGFFGGAHIGWQGQRGNFVFGVEGSISGADIEDTQTSVVNPAVEYTTEIGAIATATVKLGYAVDNVMAYVKGGYAGADVETSGFNAGLPDAFSESEWQNGWTVGGGVDYMIFNNVALGVEYNYIDLGGNSFDGITDQGIPFTLSDAETEIHTVAARLTYIIGN